MSKFQREVDEYKKQVQQTGGAYYKSSQKQSIQKPSWMTKPVENISFDLPSHPPGGYRLSDLPNSKPHILGTPIEDSPFSPETIGKMATTAEEDVLPFLERMLLGFL